MAHGQPITVDDVIFSLNILKEKAGLSSVRICNVSKVEQIGDER